MGLSGHTAYSLRTWIQSKHSCAAAKRCTNELLNLAEYRQHHDPVPRKSRLFCQDHICKRFHYQALTQAEASIIPAAGSTKPEEARGNSWGPKLTSPERR
ncbi:unnamed protein product [Fusarium graminearum]|uniref:Chromosome 1, complete genome n=1 Tax=Gibberella zeae (strain ATCC MYA-4620 / CBS 123657 / FGSC 9075 / NRRL 31084 / PH-1) TaxID=229533 RepID=I1RAX4_GIBZE|nr:hypothetical protein FGSG_00668 [Fusarium graminearum PH-1]ESU05878.1 hypothetical protein FGSG_00668 [Fusarium graminearum PH-1]EYB24323.1 hypothetical protein FG05_00668 [Fusarium graminearum]CEF72642.1 unnamed protein product [Fusarium graminearum]CZS75907.1 unnamed protein product [Fusarium graminearum]|eukprot:XP_011316363.1 hypothetical protein FGSG_00668 [Fusarium graminearum PH-1]